MVNNFFNSFEYIGLLEQSAINGNKAATMYKLQSKTHKLLGYKQGVLKKPKEDNSNQKLIDDICQTMYDNLMSFSAACEHLGHTYYSVKKFMSDKQVIQVSNTKAKYKVSYKTKRKWYA